MVRIDIILKDERGKHRTKEDKWTNLTVEQAITNLREKYGVTRGFAGWLERMDEGILKLDAKLAEEFREMISNREEVVDTYEQEESEPEEGFSRVRNME